MDLYYELHESFPSVRDIKLKKDRELKEKKEKEFSKYVYTKENLENRIYSRERSIYIHGYHIDEPCKYCTEIETYLSSSGRFTNPNQDLEKYNKSKCTCNMDNKEKELVFLRVLNLTDDNVKINVVGNYDNNNVTGYNFIECIDAINTKLEYVIKLSEIGDEILERFPNLYIIYNEYTLKESGISNIEKFKYKERLVKIEERGIKRKLVYPKNYILPRELSEIKYFYSTATIIKAKLNQEERKFIITKDDGKSKEEIEQMKKDLEKNNKLLEELLNKKSGGK